MISRICTAQIAPFIMLCGEVHFGCYFMTVRGHKCQRCNLRVVNLIMESARETGKIGSPINFDNIPKICTICLKGILAHATIVKCSTCRSSIHTRCLPNYSPLDIEYAKDEWNNWSCPGCLADLFPYNSIDSGQSIFEAINNPTNLTIDVEALESLIYDPLDLNEDDSGGALSDNDPDQIF